MNPIHFVLKMKYLNKVVFVGPQFLVWNPLCIYLRKVVQVQDGVVTRRLAIKLVGSRLIDSYSSAFGFIRNLRLFDERLNEVFNRACLGYQQVVVFLSVDRQPQLPYPTTVSRPRKFPQNSLPLW